MTEAEKTEIANRVIHHIHRQLRTVTTTRLDSQMCRCNLEPWGETQYQIWTYTPSAYLLPYETAGGYDPLRRFVGLPLDVVVPHIWTQENSYG